KLSVEFRDELRRRLIINEPQGGECTPGASLNGHPRQPQRCPIIPCSSLAGTEGQEFQGVFAKTQTPHRLFQVVHSEFVVEGQDKGLVHITVELPVRRNVYDAKRFLLELFIYTGQQETLVEQYLGTIELLQGCQL